MHEPLKLSAEFAACLDEMESGTDHLMITGKAGTGKSTLLDLFRRTTKRNIVILAPTGISALRVTGQTIHSFFRFPPRLILPLDIQSKPALTRLCKKLEVLVIDEISMVRADILDGMDGMLRLHRRVDSPFGGVRLILFGDLYQLPPIVSSMEERKYFTSFYESPYLFSAHVWRSLINVRYINLQKVYRQSDRGFIRLLDEIRNGTIDYDDLETLNERTDANFMDDIGYIHLSPRNNTMMRINSAKLNELQSEERTFMAKITGDFSSQFMPTEPVLNLKTGAQVIFIRNDAEQRYVNGTIGIITQINMDGIRVHIPQNDQTVDVAPAHWEIIRYKLSGDDIARITPEIAGTFEQLPLKLAWAMSIHKSQGQTLDRVILDMEGGAFEFGQTYVALSRCRTLQGIVLKRPLQMRDILVDERVKEFYLNNFR